MAYLECRELTKSYGRVAALEPLSLAIEVGEHVGVVGPSGAGKSTLLKLLAGVLEPSAGRILEHGRVVSAPGAVAAPHTRSLGLLLQGLGLWPHLSVRQHVLLGVPPWMRSRFGRAEIEQRVDVALAEVGLLPLAGRRPQQLSGGERQRVAWARAVVAEPELLLLDEPLSHLDPELEEDLLKLVVAFGARPGKTLILVTHRRQTAQRVSHRLIELVPARLAFAIDSTFR